MAMSQQHRHLLTRNRLRLVRDVSLNPEFYAVLQENHTLTSTMVEEIESEKTRQSKVGKLLDILPRRGSEAFPKFIDALIETHQEHLATLLDPSRTLPSPSSSGRIISQPKDVESGVDQLTPSATSSSTDRPSAAKSKGGDARSGKPLQQPTDALSGNPSSSKGPSQAQQPSCEKATSKETIVNISGCSDVDEIIHCVRALKGQGFIFDLYSPEDGDQPGKTESLKNGRCVVFRNNLPKKHSGAAYEPSFDDVNLCETFKKFGIKAESTQENKTAEDISKLLVKEANMKTNAIILFMFAPGIGDSIKTHDGKLISIVDIVDIFKNSEALRGRPKVLIFHLTDPGPVDARSALDKTDSVAEPACADPSLEFSSLSLNPSEDNMVILKVVPSSGDLTVHWLVSSLIFLMTKYSKKYDLATILERVKLILESQEYAVTLRSSLKNGLYFTSKS